MTEPIYGPVHSGGAGLGSGSGAGLGLIPDAGGGSSGGGGVGDGSGDGLPRPDGWKKMTISQRKRWKKRGGGAWLGPRSSRSPHLGALF